jgi:hypothetical protein
MARVQLVAPDGGIYSVDEEESEAAQQQHGLAPATAEQVAAFETKSAQPPPASFAAAPSSAPLPPLQMPAVPETPGRVQLVDPRDGAVYSVDEAEAEAAQQNLGYRPATPEELEEHMLQRSHGGLGHKIDAFASTAIGAGSELIETISKSADLRPVDPLTGAPVGPAPIDAQTGRLAPQAPLEAQQLTPFVYSQSDRLARRANPGWAAAGATVPDLATALLIPSAGVAGAAGSALLSGAITEAGTNVINEDEFDLKDMMLASAGAFALEGLGALAITGAIKGTARARKYLGAAVERARKYGGFDALQEADAVTQVTKLARNDEAAYEVAQTDFDAAMEAVDRRLVETPEVMFEPATLKRTVSGNAGAQEDVFLDLAVQLDNAAQVLDIDAVSKARDALQNTLGKPGHEMFAALHSAKRELEALGSESPLVQEAIQSLDGAMRSERTWGKAARTYSDVSDDAAEAIGSWNVRDLDARDALEQRLERARTRAAATGDRELAKNINKAQKALDQADKVTGARLLADTTPEDVAALKKKVENFEKRGPKLAKELSRSLQKLEKRLGAGKIPRATEDDALDYITARIHGLGGKADPLKDVLRQAEKHVDDLKKSGASPKQIARAQAEINAVRAAADEVNEIPKAARRVRQYEAHPSRLVEKAKGEGTAIIEEELEDAVGPVLRSGVAAIGGVAFGVPGYIGGYLLGRAANNRFGKNISRYIWGKARKNIVQGAVTSPGTAITGALGAGVASVFGGPKMAAAGFYAGRKGGELLGAAAKKAAAGFGDALRGGKAAAPEAADAAKAAANPPKKPPPTTPPSTPPKTPTPTKTTDGAKAASTKASAAEKEYYDKVNRAYHASQQGDAVARAAAKQQLDELLEQGVPQPRPGIVEVGKDAGRQVVEAVKKRAQALKDAAKKDPGKALGAALAPGAAYAATQEDGEEAGAAAASVGILLLFMPRGMSRIAVRRTLAETVERVAERLTPIARTRLDAILQAEADTTRRILRGAALSHETVASAEDLVRQQTRVIDEGFEQLYGTSIRMMDEREALEQYVRARLWQQNADHIDVDAELSQVWQEQGRAADQADAARRARAGEAEPSPRAQILERTGDLGADRLVRLEHDAETAMQALPPEGRQFIREIFVQAQDEVRDLTTRFLVQGGDSFAPRRVDDLFEEQIGILRRYVDTAGLEVPAEMAELAEQAARAELRRFNASYAVETRLAAQPQQGTNQVLSPLFPSGWEGRHRDINQLRLRVDSFNDGNPAQRVTEIERRNIERVLGDEQAAANLRATLTDAVAGHARPMGTIDLVIDRQLHDLRRLYDERTLNSLGNDAYARERLRLQNAVWASEDARLAQHAQRPGALPTAGRLPERSTAPTSARLQRDEPFSTPSTPPASGGTDIERRLRQQTEGATSNFRRVDDIEQGFRSLRDRGLLTPGEVTHVREAFRQAHTEVTDMVRAHVDQTPLETPDGRRLLLDSPESLHNAAREAIRRRISGYQTAPYLDDVIDAEIRRVTGQVQDAERELDASQAQALQRSAADPAPNVAEQRRRLEGLEPMGSLDDLNREVNDAYIRLRRGGMTSEESNAIRDAFREARGQLGDMQAAYVRGEPYTNADGEIVMNVRNSAALADHQRRVLREAYAGAVGANINGIPRDIDMLIELEVAHANGTAAAAALEALPAETRVADNAATIQRNTEARSSDALRRSVREDIRADQEAAGQLKNPDDMIDRPQRIDGLPTDAAIRLDDALRSELDRVDDLFRARGAGDDAIMLAEERPGLEEIARQFVRDNPGLIGEEEALAYARRRIDEVGSDEFIAFHEDGGFARSALLPPLEEAATFEMLRETVEEMADNGDRNVWRHVEGRLRDSGLTDREMRHAERVWDARESDLDEVWNTRDDANRAPDSDDYPDRSQRGSRGDYEPEDAGLPDWQELGDAGLNSAEITSAEGIRNVFGQDLDIEDVRAIFSLDHLTKYAQDTNRLGNMSTSLTVTARQVEFEAEVGDFIIHTTYRQGYEGLEVYYNLLKIPPNLQGQGAAKEIITSMVEPLERLGANKVTLSTAWIGQYAWPKLGARPSETAERMCFEAFEDGLMKAINPAARDQAVPFVMGKIGSIRDVADTWLPADMVEEALPELRLGWETLMQHYRAGNVQQMPFEEACFRTSRSGNKQFLAGKYFLLTHSGPWNSGLKLDIAPGTPWYDEFKARLGMAAVGAGAIGLGLHELAGAFSGTHAVAEGAGRPQEEKVPPEVQAYIDQQEQKTAQLDDVREKLGFVANQSQTALSTAVRSLTSRMGNERTVPVVPGKTASRGVASFMGSNASLREAYEEKREALELLQTNPEALVEELTEGLAELQETAPALHGKLVAQTYKTVQFLQGKLPSTIGASLSRPKGSPPNDLALKQFALYYSAATEPGTVLEDLANNRARREQVDTLRDVWPDAYNDLKGKLVEAMASGKPTTAQRQRLDLLFDWGDSLDTGLSSRLMAVAAQSYQKGPGGGPGGPGEPKGAPGKVPGRRTQPSVATASATASLSMGAARGVA